MHGKGVTIMTERSKKMLYRLIGLTITMILGFGCGYVTHWVLRLNDDFKRRSVFAEIAREVFVACAEAEIETRENNEETFIPQNPEIIRRIISKYCNIEAYDASYAKANQLSGPDGEIDYPYRLSDWLASRPGIFRVGPYIYFSVDSDGNRIQLKSVATPPQVIILVDVRPLSDGTILYMQNTGASYAF